MERLKIYLAGGMVSKWQDKLISALGDKFVFFNPARHDLHIGMEYTAWDLFYVDKCDILFAYMEKDNPSGIGLSLEVGYAKAKGKTIILVDERSGVDEKFCKRFNIVKESASVSYNNLEDGITLLQSFMRGIK